MLRFLFHIICLLLLKFPLISYRTNSCIFLFHYHGGTKQAPRARMQHASIWTYYTHAINRKTSRRPGL